MKMTQTQVRAAVDEWAALIAKADKIDAKKAVEMTEHRDAFQAASDAVDAKYASKLDPIIQKASAIEADVIAWLGAYGKPITITGELAHAVNEVKVGSRIADVRKFFDLAKDRFFDCVKVEIAKAEKAVGKDELNKICETSSKTVASIRMN